MSNAQEPKPVDLKRFKLLLGSSILAHFLGVWISFIVSIVGSGGSGTFSGIFFGSVIILYLGMAYIIAAWLVITLPLSALTMHFGVNEKLFTTTLLGVISGAVLVLISSMFGTRGIEQLSLSSFPLALLGGLIAAIFSFLSRVWGADQGSKAEDEVPSEM